MEGASRRFFLKALYDMNLAYVSHSLEYSIARARSEIEPGKAVTDLRKVLEDKNLDSLIITTDHRQVSASLLALEGERHVYVKKPLCGDVFDSYFHYDLWLGPASRRPFPRKFFYCTWHWWYDFGIVDVGNVSCGTLAQLANMITGASLDEVVFDSPKEVILNSKEANALLSRP